MNLVSGAGIELYLLRYEKRSPPGTLVAKDQPSSQITEVLSSQLEEDATGQRKRAAGSAPVLRGQAYRADAHLVFLPVHLLDRVDVWLCHSLNIRPLLGRSAERGRRTCCKVWRIATSRWTFSTSADDSLRFLILLQAICLIECVLKARCTTENAPLVSHGLDQLRAPTSGANR